MPQVPAVSWVVCGLCALAAVACLSAVLFGATITDLPRTGDRGNTLSAAVSAAWSQGERWETGLRDASITVAVIAGLVSVVGAGAAVFARKRKALIVWLVAVAVVAVAIFAGVITDITIMFEIDSLCLSEEKCYTCQEPCTNISKAAELERDTLCQIKANASSAPGGCYKLACDYKKLCEEAAPQGLGVVLSLCIAFAFTALAGCVVSCALDVICPPHERDGTFFEVIDVEDEDYGDLAGGSTAFDS